MKNLNSIPNLGRWSEIAQLLNENLQKIENELVSLGLSTYKGKGYFESEGALTKLYPNPQQGDWAIVDGSIYQASLDDNGYYWEDTEKDLSINVDLNEYVKEEIFSEEVAKKLSSVMILPFEGVLEKIDDSELGSGGFVTGIPYSIYYVKDKDCFFAYYNRIFNSAIYDNGVDLMPKYNNIETGKSLKNNLYIDADGNIFAFENENLKKTISAKTKYTNHAKVNKVLKELFIQKADEELNPSDYYVSVIFKKKYQGDNAQSMCQFQIRSINTNDTVCQYTDYIEDVEHEPNKLIELKESNNSGISGYAIINWCDFTENIFYYHYYSEGKAFLTNLCLDISFSPTIYSYVNKAETDSKIKKADERLSEEIETLDEQKAGKEGTYPNLTSGFADNLVGRGEATSEVFTFRQSGGNTSINDGTARLKSIKGNSVVFKQIASPSGGNAKVEKTNNGRTLLCTPTGESVTHGGVGYSSGWVYPAPYKFIHEKYYYFSFDYKRISKRTDIDDFIPKENFRIAINNDGIYIPINIGEAKHIECILKCPSDGNNVFISLNDCIVEINDLQVFDLTAMFGAGNEPQLVEEFRELYPNDYYEYNTGAIINSNYTAIESVGFNAFDGEKAEVIGGKVYELLGNYTSIGFTSVIGGELTTIEIPEDKHYTPSQNGYIYAVGSDVCIHLCHTGYKDGKYEPYRKDVINLPNIELKKAGNVYDEVRYNPNSEKWEYVQRVGSVDMGELNWVYYTNPNTTAYPYGYFAALVAGRQKGIYNILCSKYAYSGGFTVNNNIFGNSASAGVYIIDSNYTDGQVFKEAMKGQILQYELAEPIITELEGDYSTDYIVSDFGTEKAISDKLCAPFSADIIYQFNAVDRIRENSAKIEELQAEDTNIKAKTLNLTVKDNGNIVLANADGVSQEFMPATPSGDPNHYMYVEGGAVWNNDTGYWELNGLTDLTNDEIRDCWVNCNLKFHNYIMLADFHKLTSRTNFPRNYRFEGDTIGGRVSKHSFNCVFEECGNLEIINFAEGVCEMNEIAYNFCRSCSKLREIQGVVKFDTNAKLVQAFKNCKSLRTVKFYRLNQDLDISGAPLLDKESVLYMIQNAYTNTFIITLHADAYANASADEDIQAALEIKTNIKLQSA